jgi:AbrB family looped-hinge helix DNA binding protein
MSLTSHITRNFRITIPKEIRNKLPYLNEGDPVEFQIEGERLILIPYKKIPEEQSYYWSAKWQEGIKEAKDDIREGRILGPYDDVEEGLNALKQDI